MGSFDLRHAKPVRWVDSYLKGLPTELPVFVVVGTILRVYQLGAESLWIDEVFMTTMATERSLFELLFVIPTFEPHPPLYNVLIWGWAQMAGASPLAMRSTSVVFSIAAIPTCYLLGRVLFDRWTATVGTAMLVVSPFQIWHGQEARMYPLLVLATVVSFYILLRLIEQPTSRRIGGYILVGVILGYTHVYGLFVLLAQGLFAVEGLARGRGEYRLSPQQLITTFGAIFVLILPWTGLLIARVIVPDRFPPDAAAWVQAPSNLELIDSLRLLIFGATDMTRPYEVLTAPSDALLFPAILCLGLLAAFSTFQGFGDDSLGVRLAVLWVVVTAIVPIGLSLTVRPIFQLRYLIVASPAVYLLLGRGTQAVSILAVRYILAGVLVLALVVPLPGYYAEPTRDQWDTAADDVAAKADANDVVLVVPGWTWDGASGAFRYYFNQPEVAVEPLYSFSPPGSYREAVVNRDDVYLVVSYTNERTAVIDRVANATGQEPTDRRTYISIIVVNFESNETASAIQTNPYSPRQSGAPAEEFSTRYSSVGGVNLLKMDSLYAEQAQYYGLQAMWRAFY